MLFYPLQYMLEQYVFPNKWGADDDDWPWWTLALHFTFRSLVWTLSSFSLLIASRSGPSIQTKLANGLCWPCISAPAQDIMQEYQDRTFIGQHTRHVRREGHVQAGRSREYSNSISTSSYNGSGLRSSRDSSSMASESTKSLLSGRDQREDSMLWK